MILLIHMLFGAAIALHIKNPILAIILAFLSHYLLDFFPHKEYDINNISEKRWKKAVPEFQKVFLDFLLGILLILLFSNNRPIIYICAFFAILPDGFSVLSSIFQIKILKVHNNFHQGKLHFFKKIKISNFWRILSQILILLIALAALLPSSL